MPEPSVPDSTCETKARTLFGELVTVSRTILETGNDPAQTAEISQLVMKRGQLLDEIRKLDLSTLPDGVKREFSEQLDICRAMDEPIARNFSSLAASIEKQIQSSRTTRKVIGKYKSNRRKHNSSRTSDA